MIAKNYERYGYWWANGNVELVKINDRIFALNLWNGKAFTHCWECQNDCPLDGQMNAINLSLEFTITPTYLYELEDIDISGMVRGSPEWDSAHEIILYTVEES